MNVFISADIEGCTGLVSWHQCGAASSQYYDYPFARRMMTHDVNAAIRGARRAGAKRIVVKDSHNNSKNLLIDELEEGVEIVSGLGAGIAGMMEGIDESFDAAMLIGYHAMAGTTGGIMEHTFTGGVHRLWINDIESGEIGLSAGVAGFFGVPIVAISSDVAGCDEAARVVDGISVAKVKEGLGRYSGRALHSSETAPLIEKAAEEGLKASQSIAPVKHDQVSIRIEFNHTEEADFGAKHPLLSRVNGYTVEFSGADFLQAHQLFLNAMTMSGAGVRSMG